jgi:hypothetical protein
MDLRLQWRAKRPVFEVEDLSSYRERLMNMNELGKEIEGGLVEHETVVLSAEEIAKLDAKLEGKVEFEAELGEGQMTFTDRLRTILDAQQQ